MQELQEQVRNREGFAALTDYFQVTTDFLAFLRETHPTRIISPSTKNYIFFQYGKEFEHKITRPLNSDLFIEDEKLFLAMFGRFTELLAELRQSQESLLKTDKFKDHSDQLNRRVQIVVRASVPL